MPDHKFFDNESVETLLAGLDPNQHLAPLPISSLSATRRVSWLKDEAHKLDEWLVYPTYQRVVAEIEAGRLPGTYVHGSTVVLRGRDRTGKLRPIKAYDVSLYLTAGLQRQLTGIYEQVRHEQIVLTGGRYLTEEQFDAMPDATYKALTMARSSDPSGGRRPAGRKSSRRSADTRPLNED